MQSCLQQDLWKVSPMVRVALALLGVYPELLAHIPRGPAVHCVQLETWTIHPRLLFRRGCSPSRAHTYEHMSLACTQHSLWKIGQWIFSPSFKSGGTAFSISSPMYVQQYLRKSDLVNEKCCLTRPTYGNTSSSIYLINLLLDLTTSDHSWPLT